MRIGAHESIAGGLALAFERAVADGAEALQIFTKSGRQWNAKALEEADIRAFKAAQAKTGLPVIVHDSYLINLGSEPGEIRQKSVAAFRDELERCEALGIEWLVAHPGANSDETRGLSLIGQGLSETFEATRGAKVGVLLEITAGQGVTLGHRFEHLAQLLHDARTPERLGICLDTCHLFAAGYDLSTEAGYDETMDALDRVIGLGKVRAIHVNDCQKGLGCRVDRHARIGHGTLGIGAFRRLVRDPRLAGRPAVLETPEGLWKDEIAFLKALRAGVDHPPLPGPTGPTPTSTSTSTRSGNSPQADAHDTAPTTERSRKTGKTQDSTVSPRPKSAAKATTRAKATPKSPTRRAR